MPKFIQFDVVVCVFVCVPQKLMRNGVILRKANLALQVITAVKCFSYLGGSGLRKHRGNNSSSRRNN